MQETLSGQGVTRERLRKSPIKTAPRVLTLGGMVLTYGQHDTEHCTLDILKNKGFIEPDQYDAGYSLRNLYYSFTITGRWIEEGGKAYDGDTETLKDIAENGYHDAMRSIDPKLRPLIRTICIDYSHIPADFILIQSIKSGLNELLKHFRT